MKASCTISQRIKIARGNPIRTIGIAGATATLSIGFPSCHPAEESPNIILILVDDLGYGDVSCYNDQARLTTPHIDHLAEAGMRFTDAHASAAQSSPTRYGLLTGRYSWRTRLQVGVLPHFDEPLIEKDRVTLASLLKEQGYSTACIGKWHLGLGWQTLEGDTIDPRSWSARQNLKIDYSKPLTTSPNDYGFDYYFGINASNNMLPYCLIENNCVVTVPGKPKFPVFDTETGVGLVSEDYDSQKLEKTLFRKAMTWLEKQKEEHPGKPFFLYYPMSAIHRPCLPDDPFIGKGEAGLKGGKILETDYYVGQLMEWLEREGLDENTLFIFTSDNGGRPGDPEYALRQLAANDYGRKYEPGKWMEKDSLVQVYSPYEKPEGSENYHIYGHYSSAGFRGYKFDIYEGGHRVPFIITWPGVVEAGTVCNELVSTLDILATLADLMNADLPSDAGEDSFSFLPCLLGEEKSPVRPNLVHKAWYAGKLAIRKGNWKLIPFRDGGGIYQFPEVDEEGQLYDLENDPSESVNLYDQKPEVVAELRKELENVMEGEYQTEMQYN
ncbi:MAG: sulfatase family protein [Bacteroidales bacterium]